MHVSADFGPYGTARDEAVDEALGDVPLRPDRLAVRGRRRAGCTKADGEVYKVYSPFYRAWRDHGWRKPGHRRSPGGSTGTPA